MKSIRAVLCWDNWADYHYDRLNIVLDNRAAGPVQVVGMELVRKTNSHRWASFRGRGLATKTITKEVPQGILETVSFGFKLLWYLAQDGCDVVFVPSYWPIRPALVLACSKLLGLSTVMMNDSHAKSGQHRQSIGELGKRILLLLFDAGFVAGTAHIRHFSNLGFRPNRLFAGYDAIDGAALRAQEADTQKMEELDDHYGCPTLCYLFIGRLVKEKNLSSLIHAYALLRSKLGMKVPALVLVGEGDQKQGLIAIADGYGIPVHNFTGSESFKMKRGAICFYPFCRNRETVYFYRNALAFVLPSQSETWGLVVSEAIALGIPVFVSSNVGCVDDLVLPENGATFPPGEPEKLAALLERAILDPSWVANMREGATALGAKIQIEEFAVGFRLAAECAVEQRLHGAIV